MKESLYLIHTSEDGDVSIRKVTTKDLADYKSDEWIPDIGKGLDLLSSGGCILIKGQIVVPMPKTVVVEYEV